MNSNFREAGQRRRVLLYEPRAEGHHPVWLKMIAEDLLAAGCQLTLAVAAGTAAREQITKLLRPLLPHVRLTDAASNAAHLARAAQCQAENAADIVFFCCFDEVASACLRRAAIGWLPPANLQGRLSGIYMRPRFLSAGRRGLNEGWKRRGFHRLTRGSWFGPMFFLDEMTCERGRAEHLQAPFHWLPDPALQEFKLPKIEARARLALPADKKIFLFYGGAYRRKGLHLALEAMLKLPDDHPSFLLCAGRHANDETVAAGLRRLVAQGRAAVLDRYVSAEEEEGVFCASDYVLLPYLQHFGSSGVQAQAAAAGKPVIASDENLVAQRVRQFNTGWLFPSGDTNALARAMQTATSATIDEYEQFVRGSKSYAQQFSREAFRAHLLRAFQ